MNEVMAIYEKLKDRITRDEFFALLEEKENLMGEFIDKETAALLVEHDVGGSVNQMKISQITQEISNVTVVGKVIMCSDVRTFAREDGSTGSVANLTLGDETGSIRVVLWDQAADLVKVGEVVFGDTVQVSGFVKEGRNGLEISTGRSDNIDKMALSEEIQVRMKPFSIREIGSGMSNVHVIGKILNISDIKSFNRKDGTSGRVRNITLGDTTGKIKVAIWDDKVDKPEQFAAGDTVEISGADARENTFNNQVEINMGYNSSIRKSREQIDFEEQITAIADIKPNESYSIVGYVTGLNELKEFQRKDGSSGRVVNIHISDDTGRIRISLWDDNTDYIKDIDIGTKLQINDCYAKSGWNEEVELSAGVRSTIIILK